MNHLYFILILAFIGLFSCQKDAVVEEIVDPLVYNADWTDASYGTITLDYIDITFKFNGKTLKNSGFRLKGNSTLQTTWISGIYKLPFRLNFDKMSRGKKDETIEPLQ